MSKRHKQKNPARVASAIQLNERKKREAQEEAYKNFANNMMDELGFMKKYGPDTNLLLIDDVYSIISEFMEFVGINPKENND